ncbi:response regulator transcription factor [Fibrobacter sp.]|uniref:response regulator transcription factor n=1 Tax=Fibrobacter sp. TaxID=35828 RepID=UPI00388E2586
MIYIVEDDPEICELESCALQNAGFEVATFDCGKKMDEKLRCAVMNQDERPSLFILDVMLPGEDGLSILKRLRAQAFTRQVPVMMLTAKGTEMDKVRGLDLGADDYLSKPFGVMEFISRVKALLRRSGVLAANPEESKIVLQMLGVVLDDSRHKVTVDGKIVDLAFKEYELLKMLMEKPGVVCNRQEIMERVWGVGLALETRTVDVHIGNIRQKLGEKNDFIKTVRNVGYKAEV